MVIRQDIPHSVKEMDTYYKDESQDIIKNFNFAATKFKENFAKFFSTEELSGSPNISRLTEDYRHDLEDILERLFSTYERMLKLYLAKCFWEQYQTNSKIITEQIYDLAFKCLLGILHSNLVTQHQDVLCSIGFTNMSNTGKCTILTLEKLMGMYSIPHLRYYDNNFHLFVSSIRTPVPQDIDMDGEKGINTYRIRTGYRAYNRIKHTPPCTVQELFNGCYQSFRDIQIFIETYISRDFPLEDIRFKPISGDFCQLWEYAKEYSTRSGCTYILITDSLKELSESEQDAILRLPWSLVIDYDPSSQTEGLYHHYIEITSEQPSIIFPLVDNMANFELVDSRYWIFPNGSELQQDTKPNNDQKRRKMLRNFENIIGCYHTAVSRPAIVTVLNGDSEISITGQLIEKIYDTYQDEEDETPHVFFLTLVNNVQYRSGIGEEAAKKSIFNFDISRIAFASSVKTFFALPDTAGRSSKVPLQKGGAREIVPSHYQSLDIVYIDIAEHQENDPYMTDSRLFYEGAQPLSWYGIQHQFAVRPASFLECLRIDSNEKIGGSNESTLRLIRNDPGAGGSTFLRMLIYERAQRQPAFLVTRYLPNRTAEQIEDLYNACDNSPLYIGVDSGNLRPDECVSLKRELEARYISHIMVYAVRNHVYVDGKADTIYRAISWPPVDAKKMKEKLDDNLPLNVPERRERMEKLDALIDQGSSERIPFIMSLYAFEEKFQGVSPYVKHFMDSISTEQKKVLCYFAIADYYANEKIDENFFPKATPTLSMESDDADDTGVFLAGEAASDAARKLLIYVIDNETRYVKVRHPEFSKEILSNCLGTLPSNDTSTHDKLHYYTKLSQSICDLIDYSYVNATCDSTTRIDFLRSLLITKTDYDDDMQNERSQQPHFGPIIEVFLTNLSSKEQMENLVGPIFKKLSECYATDYHFVAHYGRYFRYVAEDYKRAVEKAQEAVTLMEHQGDKDSIIYHILGSMQKAMVINKLMVDIHYHSEVSQRKLIEKEILSMASLASENFRKSQSDNSLAGYESDFDLCFCMVDFCRKLYNLKKPKEVYVSVDSNIAPYKEYFSRALQNYEILEYRKSYSFVEANESSQKSSISKGRAESRKGNYLELTADIASTVEYWRRLTKMEDTSNTIQCQRRLMCVRAALGSGEQKWNSNDLREFIRMMEDNLDVDPGNVPCLVWWFRLYLQYTAERPEIVLKKMDMALERWAEALEGSVDLLFYRFLIASLRALDGESIAEGRVRKLSQELNTRTDGLEKSATPRFVYGADGDGISKLLPWSDFCKIQGDSEDDYSACEKLIGTVTYKSFQTYSKGFIETHGMEVFFAPSRQKYITSDARNKEVEFCLAFSLSGARALYNSVTLSEDSSRETSFGLGDKVVATVKRLTSNGKLFVSFDSQVHAYGYMEMKNFDVREIKKRPEVGDSIVVWIISEKPEWVPGWKAGMCWQIRNTSRAEQFFATHKERPKAPISKGQKKKKKKR